MRKLALLLSITLCLLFFVPPAQALEIEATSAILIDAASGRVLFEQDANRRLPVASITKILTALVVLEHFDDLKQTYTLPEDFVNVGESNIWLEAGETHTIEDLLYALLLRSANDAGQALALATAGSEAAFANMMNERCRQLGLTNSNWVNPHGLHDDSHLSTAYDIAVITREAQKIPEFNTIIATPTHTIPWETNEYDRVVASHNKLLEIYEGADGVKTGYTSKAGNCLVGSATRNGLRLIGVVLNTEDIYAEMAKLLDYGFENYEMRQIADFGAVATRIPVIDGKGDSVNALFGSNVRILLPKDAEYQAEPTFDVPDKLQTPIDSGVPLGEALFDDGTGYINKVALYPADDMERYTFWGVVRAAFMRIVQVLIA